MRGKNLFGAASAALLVGLGLGVGTASAQGADQPGDRSTQARVTSGQAATGEISPAADQDWFRLRVESGQRYRITLEGVGEGETTLDPVLSIYDSTGQQVAQNDDSDGSLNSMLSYTPSATGEVFVGAGGFLDEATGAYRLMVEASAAPADDAGNDATTRARVTAGRPTNGSLDYESDVDWYRFAARTGQRYVITLNSAEGAASPLGDPVLRVIGRDGVEIGVSDDTEEGLNSRLEFVPQGNGDVFLEAGGFGGAATGAYTLNVTTERLPSDAASGDRNTRASLVLERSVRDGIDFAGDRDWRRIRLQEGQSYRFTLNSDAEHATPIADPVLRLLNSAGEEIAADDDGGEGFNAYLEYAATQTGVYYIEARSFDEASTGGYVLTAHAGDIPQDASTDATLSMEGEYREGVLAPMGDKDWYRIDMAEGQGMRLTVSTAQTGDGLPDPFIVLYGPDGAEIARDDDSAEGLNAFLEYSALSAGPHYLEVRGFVEESGAGRYTIQLAPGEIGASPDEAEYLTVPGEGRASSIAREGDVDWFAVDLVEGRPYRFNLLATDGGLDPMLTLLDMEGNQVASDDDGGQGVNSYISFASVTGGRYYLAVSAFNNGSTGAYMLTAADTDVPGGFEITDESLSEGEDRVSRIDIPGDLDTYRVELEAGVRYTIEVRGEGDQPLADPFVAVLNGNGERVISDDDSGPGLDARVRFTPTEGGSFFLQASGLGGSIGGYRVSIARN